MALTKTSLVRIKSGSQVKIDNDYTGYTRGGSIKIDRVYEDIESPLDGIVGTKLLEYTATITVNFLQLDSVTKDLIFGSGTFPGEPPYHTLEVIYTTRSKPTKDVTVKFTNVYVLDTGEITIEGRSDVVFPVTFKAIKDSSGNIIEQINLNTEVWGTTL